MTAMEEPALRMLGMRKSFNGVEVLHGVDFLVFKGEVHALVGQNGAGKSTLMKILSGVYLADAGEITIDGEPALIETPVDAHRHGIRMVFQEFSLVPHLSVTDNIFLNQELTHLGAVDVRQEQAQVRQLMSQLAVDIAPQARVQALSVGDRQMVEIAKALSQNPRVLVLDEPTASLSRTEVERLFRVVERLRATGIGVVFISHHIEEIVELCDKVTVLRDGSVVGELSGATVDEIVSTMLGETAGGLDVPGDHTSATATGELLFELSGVHPDGREELISFSVRRGEVVGIAGLLGSGRTEILEVLFGLRTFDHGRIALSGRPYAPSNPGDAMRAGLMLISEDRRTSGVVLGQSVMSNMLLPVWRLFSRWGWISKRRSVAATSRLIDSLAIKTRGPGQTMELLSGGNQQKVLVGRALSVDPSVLMLDEPTAGIDIGARREIVQQCRRLAAGGRAVLWVSSDMQELASVCDRVLVLRNGSIANEITEPTEAVLVAAIQQDKEAAS